MPPAVHRRVDARPERRPASFVITLDVIISWRQVARVRPVAIVAMAILAFNNARSLAAQAPAGAPYPPLGALVDVGGYRVHLHCTGTGRPAVVIVGSGYSFDWSLVQGPVSTFTKVCTYDPAGSAWSDPGPAPTCNGRVLEIHRALQNGGVDGPIVLVGHSIGAVFSRLYADRYPAAVAGMVLSDHAGRCCRMRPVFHSSIDASRNSTTPRRLGPERSAIDRWSSSAIRHSLPPRTIAVHNRHCWRSRGGPRR